MRRRCQFAVATAALLSVTSPAWAGHPQERQGFWIGFGGGYGSASVEADCSDCKGDREGSFTGFVKLGGTLNKNVLLGVESNAWVKDEDGATLTLGGVTGTVTFYPQASSGFFVKGGLGFSYVSTEVRVGSVSVSASKTGWASWPGRATTCVSAATSR